MTFLCRPGGLAAICTCFQVGGQIMQAIKGGFGQALTNNDHKMKVLVGLLFQSGQGDGFKQPESFVQPFRLIQKLPPFFDSGVHGLKPTNGRIRKTAKTEDLHPLNPAQV